MRLILTLVLSIALMGCSAKEWEVVEYHETLRQTNNTIVKSLDSQVQLQHQRSMDSLRYFSSAMIQASETEDPTDGATIAFAWGFQSSQPNNIVMPNVQHPAPPVTDVDRVKAWTPIVTMTVPYVAPMIFNGYGNSGTKIAASDQATIMQRSGNAGSYNQVSGSSPQPYRDADGNIVRDAHGNPILPEGVDPETAGPAIGNSIVTNKHDDLIIYNEGGGDLGNVLPYFNTPTVQPLDGEGSLLPPEGGLTEEWCNSQGLTLRESTGECITYEYKSNIENARLLESQGGSDE
jgi:hypothetical protein